MVSKAGLTVSFFALLSSWVVGVFAARIFGWQFEPLSFSLSSPLEFLWLCLAALVFCAMFFGRTGFLVFFALGLLQSGPGSYALMFALFFKVLVLAWFGMLGTMAGELLFNDLREKREFDMLEKKIVVLFLVGVFVALAIAAFSGALENTGRTLTDVARKIHNRELSLDSVIDFFRPQDANAVRAAPG